MTLAVARIGLPAFSLRRPALWIGRALFFLSFAMRLVAVAATLCSAFAILRIGIRLFGVVHGSQTLLDAATCG